MSPDDTGANAVVFAGLKFVLGALGVVSLDDGEPSEAAVDTVVGLAIRVSSADVKGSCGGTNVVEIAAEVAAARVRSAGGEGSSNDVNVVEAAAEVAAARVSSAGSNGAK